MVSATLKLTAMGPAELHAFLPASPLQRLEVPSASLPVYRCDVLVIGSGAAGLSTALTAADEGSSVFVLSKGALSNTNTSHAQGGMAAAIGADDSPDFHIGDTLDVGYGLCEPAVVDAFAREGPSAVEWLLRSGMQFDRQPDGKLALGREGGHRVARVLHSGGAATGQEMQRVLSARARNHRSIQLFEHVAAVDLLKDESGRVGGLLALHGGKGRKAEPVLFEAGAVVIATGGGGQIFRETTNPELATADGIAMALRAGAELQDLEFVQFHPTILYLAGAARFLISEITRGAGAVLRDRHGIAFMDSAHPSRDLAPRDVVSRAIFRCMIQNQDTHVYLDLTNVDDPAAKFPGLNRITRQFGMDLAQDPIPVRPAVHYMVGGVRSDQNGRTSIPGLWAVGECASTGFHGANRMGSNSLLEGLVQGRMVGRTLANQRLGRGAGFVLPERGKRSEASTLLNLTDMTYSLKSLMWRQVGIEREQSGLEDAVRRLETWEGYLARLGPFSREGVEVVNMVQVGAAITYSALFRQESRGTHFRTDFADSAEDWRIHTLLSTDGGGLHMRTRPVSGSDAPSKQSTPES
jgi:L-aspartate oxidase